MPFKSCKFYEKITYTREIYIESLCRDGTDSMFRHVLEEKINYRTACTSDTFCAKLVRATSVRILPKCRPMIVYKREKLPHFFELHS